MATLIPAGVLTLCLVAWITFVYVQFKYGDRPTSPQWFAIAAGMGSFEYLKSILTLVESGAPALPMAAIFATIVGGGILMHQRAVAAGSTDGVVERMLGNPQKQMVASDA